MCTIGSIIVGTSNLRNRGVAEQSARDAAWHWGDSAKDAIAFKPQSTASAIQTEIILWLRMHHPEVAEWLRLIVHDELVFDMPNSLVDYATPIIKTAMTQPWPQLEDSTMGVRRWRWDRI